MFYENTSIHLIIHNFSKHRIDLMYRIVNIECFHASIYIECPYFKLTHWFLYLYFLTLLQIQCSQYSYYRFPFFQFPKISNMRGVTLFSLKVIHDESANMFKCQSFHLFFIISSVIRVQRYLLSEVFK